MEPAPGVQVNERVTLTAPLARGSFGAVWRAQHTGLGIEVAVKFVSEPGAPLRKDAVKRFALEASAAAQIQSPHVVRMFDHGVTPDGTPYLVMELMQGESLAERLEHESRLSLAETAGIVAQAAKALAAAHALGVIHRDIKPSNLFLTKPHEEMLVKVLDFGVAKQTKPPKPGSIITEPGMIIGTPAYLCRDIFVAKASLADPQVDLWALAVVAYRCLTGRLPFGEGASIQDTCKAIIEGTFTPPTGLRPELGADVDRWFERAFAREPSARFSDANELGRSILKLASLPSLVPPPRADKPVPTYYAIAGGAVLMLALVGGAILLWKATRTPASPAAPPSAAPPTALSSPAAALPAPPARPPLHTSTEPPSPPRSGEVWIPGGSGVDGFFMDKTEVTVLAYGKCVLAGGCNDRLLQAPIEIDDPSRISPDCNWRQTRREHHPMNCVSWTQADAFCRSLGTRLPTEAEWMRAARGDDNRGFPWGDVVPSCERAVMSDALGKGCGKKTTWTVASQPLDKSPFGGFDMAGNLREWVSDWHDSKRTERIVKGGSFTDTTDFGIAKRRAMNPDARSISVGFRCVRSPAT